MDKEELINIAIGAMKRCIAHNDMYTALVLIQLCRHIAGEDFEVKISVELKGQVN